MSDAAGAAAGPSSGHRGRYSLILLKISGEALLGTRPYGVDPAVCAFIAHQVREVRAEGVEVAIVVGGGNIFRGLAASAKGMDRATGDYMGMLATVMNGLALQDALEAADGPVYERAAAIVEVGDLHDDLVAVRAGSGRIDEQLLRVGVERFLALPDFVDERGDGLGRQLGLADLADDHVEQDLIEVVATEPLDALA